MLYPIGKVEDLQKLEELDLLKNQVQDVRLQDKLGKQNFHENTKKLFVPLTDTIKNTSQNNRGLLASYSMSHLSRITNPETTTQFRLVKTSSSNSESVIC